MSSEIGKGSGLFSLILVCVAVFRFRYVIEMVFVTCSGGLEHFYARSDGLFRSESPKEEGYLYKALASCMEVLARDRITV
jgi:hypothetical protein